MNKAGVAGCRVDTIPVEIGRVEAAEADARWSFGQHKGHHRWLGHASDPLTGVGLAYTFGSRADEVFVELHELLQPFGLEHCYTDAAGGYERQLPAAAHTVGKSHTQPIERQPLPLRTRIKRLTRKTIGFSNSVFMHDTVIGLFVNRYEFGTPI